MYNKIADSILPVVGGATGAATQTAEIMSQVSLANCINAAILAAIGAIVGYMIKLGLDYFVKKCKNRK